jgi:hypothetical protein
MFYVENVSGSEKVWGGQIYANTQKRLVDESDLSAYKGDTAFLACVLDGSSKVYTDENCPLQPQAALDYINGEENKTPDGVKMVRITTVPADYQHRFRSVEFTTGQDGSLKQEWWFNDQGMECYLEFKKLNPSTGLLEYCDPSVAEFTLLVWMPTYQTLGKSIKLRLPEKNANILAWVGLNLLDAEELGRLYGRVSFKFSAEWEASALDLRPILAPVRVYVSHPVGAAVDIEASLEYYTNLVVLE